MSSRLTRRPAILDKSLNKNKTAEVSLAAYSFLFSEILQYSQKKVSGVVDLEKRLSDLGYRVGLRMFELTVWRERNVKRENRVLGILYFINTTIWKALFGKAADSLEKGTDNIDEYMISDNDPQITKFISVPKELSSLNCGAFVAGMIEAILDTAGFPCQVTAHSTSVDGFPSRTTFLIKFDKSVIQREKALEK